MSFFEAVRRVVSGRAAPGNRTPAAERPAASAAATEPIRSTDTHPSGYPAEVGGPAPDDAVARRQERAAERLLEDERLRGSMTDDEFKPLLEWALATVDRVAAATAGEPDAVAAGEAEAVAAGESEDVGAEETDTVAADVPEGG